MAMNSPRCSLRFLAVLTSLACADVTLRADDILKANNNDALNLTSSWQGGQVPTSADVAVFGSQILQNRTVQIGANLAFSGIEVGAMGASVTTITINGTNTLTLGADGIDMSAASGNLTINPDIVLGSDQTWTVAAGRALGAQNLVSGSGHLTLAGSGSITMNNSVNTYTGGTTIGEGTVVRINGSTAAGASLGTGAVVMENNARIQGTSSGNRYLSNSLTLNGDIIVGTSEFSSSNIGFLGGVNLGGQTRSITIVSNTGTNAGLSLSGEGKSVSGGGRLVLVNGNAAGSPDVLVRLGEASQAFTVESDMTISSGVKVYFQTSNILTNTVDLTIQSGGMLDLSNMSGSALTQTVRTLTGGGTITSNRNNASALSTLIIDGGASTDRSTFSGNIVTGTAGASTHIIKNGQTTQVLSGSSNYNGQTQANAGTLLINGVHTGADSGSGYGGATNGRYLVESGGTLGGSGRINLALASNTNANNAIYVKSGGILAPGDGVGTLTLDAAGFNRSGGNDVYLNMAAGSEFAFQLAGDGSASDTIAMWNYAAGDLLLNGNKINLTLSGPLVEGTYTVDLFAFFSDSGVTAATGITTGLTLGAIDPNIVGTPTLIYDSAGGLVSLQYTVIPEPSVCLLVGGSLFFLLFRRRLAKLVS